MVRLDPGGSRIEFTLGATMHTVEGTFAPPSGSVRFDPASGSASGRIVVDARSAGTGNRSRDRRMHEEILESDRYPEIVLTLTHVEGTPAPRGESDLTLRGTMDIHGGTHDIRIPAHVRVDGPDVSGTARFDVPYVDWGMKDPSVFVLRVEKHVHVTVTFSGSFEQGEAPGDRDAEPRRTATPPG